MCRARMPRLLSAGFLADPEVTAAGFFFATIGAVCFSGRRNLGRSLNANQYHPVRDQRFDRHNTEPKELCPILSARRLGFRLWLEPAP